MHTFGTALIVASLLLNACSYASDRQQEPVTMEPATKPATSAAPTATADAAAAMGMAMASASASAAAMPTDAGPSPMMMDGGASLDAGTARDSGAAKDAGAAKKK